MVRPPCPVPLEIRDLPPVTGTSRDVAAQELIVEAEAGTIRYLDVTSSGELSSGVLFNLDEFDESTIEGWAADLQQILTSAVASRTATGGCYKHRKADRDTEGTGSWTSQRPAADSERERCRDGGREELAAAAGAEGTFRGLHDEQTSVLYKPVIPAELLRLAYWRAAHDGVACGSQCGLLQEPGQPIRDGDRQEPRRWVLASGETLAQRIEVSVFGQPASRQPSLRDREHLLDQRYDRNRPDLSRKTAAAGVHPRIDPPLEWQGVRQFAELLGALD
jgi:hypothetical protein